MNGAFIVGTHRRGGVREVIMVSVSGVNVDADVDVIVDGVDVVCVETVDIVDVINGADVADVIDVVNGVYDGR